MKEPRATIVDVARAAGVSLSTVSRVMNGNATVDPELAERVRTTAAALDYSANPLARSLVLGRTHTVAVLVPDLANPTFQAMLRGLSRGADEDGYHVLISDTDERSEREAELAATIRRRTDGIVLCAPRMPQEQLTAAIAGLGPVVVVNRPPQDGVPTVRADYAAAMHEIIAHVHGLGHRRLVFLSGANGSASLAARRTAFDEARERFGDLTIREVSAGVDFASGAAAVDAVVASGATCVLAFNDLVAMGLLSALGDRGVRVPDDLSIVGFDDIPFAPYTAPALTTAAVEAVDLGLLAWEAMHLLLTGGAPEASRVITPRLIVRGSTAPPRL